MRSECNFQGPKTSKNFFQRFSDAAQMSCTIRARFGEDYCWLKLNKILTSALSKSACMQTKRGEEHSGKSCEQINN